jgi:hypothetical protein
MRAFLLIDRKLSEDEHYDLYRELLSRIHLPADSPSISSGDGSSEVVRILQAIATSFSAGEVVLSAQLALAAQGASISDSEAETIALIRNLAGIARSISDSSGDTNLIRALVAAAQSLSASSGSVSIDRIWQAVCTSISNIDSAVDVATILSAIATSQSSSGASLTHSVSQLAAIANSISGASTSVGYLALLGNATVSSQSIADCLLRLYYNPRTELEAINAKAPNIEYDIKQYDTEPPIRLSLLWPHNQQPHDLTNTTVRFYMYSIDDESGEKVMLVNGEGIVENPPTLGTIRYDWQAGDTSVAGYHVGEFEVTKRDGNKYSQPSRGFIIVRIHEDLNDE